MNRESWIYDSAATTYDQVSAFNELTERYRKNRRYPKHLKIPLRPDVQYWANINSGVPLMLDDGALLFTRQRFKREDPHTHIQPWNGYKSNLLTSAGKRWGHLRKNVVIGLRAELLNPDTVLLDAERKTSHRWCILYQTSPVIDYPLGERAGNPTFTVMLWPGLAGEEPKWRVTVRGDSRPIHTRKYEYEQHFDYPMKGPTIDFRARYWPDWHSDQGFARWMVNGAQGMVGRVPTAFNSEPAHNKPRGQKPPWDFAEQHDGIPCFGMYAYGLPDVTGKMQFKFTYMEYTVDDVEGAENRREAD